MSNDLVATNEARRDSVALMIYNMLNPIASNDEENSEEIETGKINTKTAYAGFVTAQLKRSAEDRVKVIDTEGTEVELKLADKKLIPGINSFIIYQFNLSGEINIRKELKISDIDNSFLLVNKIEDTIVKLAGEEKPLDLELDEYRVGGKTIKLNKINFFIIELDTEENEFVDYKLYNMNELKLKENDKLKFDDKLNVCYVVRELD